MSNQLFFANFASLTHLRRFVYIYWGHLHWLFHIPHGSAHILIPLIADSLTMDRETVYHYILVRPSEFSQPRPGNRHWILQAALGFRHIIYASHVEILYANINQSQKQPSTTALISLILFVRQAEVACFSAIFSVAIW